jgi:arsenate reductase (thioredoxin)
MSATSTVPALVEMQGVKKKVLFICVHNSARSQMAEAYLNHKYGDKFIASSGGVEPGTLNPLAVKAMKEAGLDISHNRTKSVDEFIRPNLSFDYVVTVCDQARKSCPFFPARVRLYADFPDPADFTGSEEDKLAEMRKLRDALIKWIDRTFGSEAEH